MKKTVDSSYALAAWLIGFVAMLVLVPLAYIWAWNQLFGSFLLIQYTFWNWLAVVILPGLFTIRKIK